MIRVDIPHLETDVTQACQLSCVACNHAVPLYRKRGPTSASVSTVDHDLSTLARVLRADAWGALGGEPLLHKDITEILRVARRSGVADRIEVWSNGLLLPRMTDEFWRSFDRLVLSVYEGKHTDESLRWITERCQEANVELHVKDERVDRNFMTLLEPVPTEPRETKRKFKHCFFRHFSRVANDGFFFTCCCAPHLPVLLQDQSFGTDGIPITDDMAWVDVYDYLNRVEPLGACTICAGRQTAQPLTWREERNPDAWVRASKGEA